MNRATNRQLPNWSVAALALLAALPVQAKPLAMFSFENVSIELRDEDCKLDIKNLPKRAVWIENGKPVEGCYGVSGQFRFVFFYFADKTATGLPIQLFSMVNET